MKEWKRGLLKDFIEIGNGRSRPLGYGDIPVFGGNGILSYCNFCNYRGETIIVGRVGAYCGSVYYSNNDIWISDNALSVKALNKNSTKYLYYCLKNMNLNQFAEGSSHPLLTHSLIYALPVQLPEPIEQRAIASVLSSLDEKIDLLHRQNKTLEKMAETLFKQWFVVEAKEEWEEGILGNFTINVKNSVNPSKYNYNKYVGLEHIDKKNISLSKYGFTNDVTSNKYTFKKFDILFGKLRPYFHKVCIAPFDGVCSTDILVIRPIRLEMLPFCLFAFFQDEVINYANFASEGTRMPRTDWNVLAQFPFPVPDESTLSRYNEIVSNCINKILHNIEQIRTLENLRDTLLPKLMRGEVRVQYDEDTP